jgi:hypothetical protein
MLPLLSGLPKPSACAGDDTPMTEWADGNMEHMNEQRERERETAWYFEKIDEKRD